MSSAARRLYLVSDIHVDAQENMRWLEQLSSTYFLRDALIVAGDVSEDLELVEVALQILAAKFELVYFTPGNHDLWVNGDGNSMTKLHAIFALCDRLGVATRPRRFGDKPEGCGIWVCPLLSFHHSSFDTEPDVRGWAVPSAEEVMVDYRACTWPDGLSMLDDSVAAAMDAANEQHWSDDGSDQALAQRPRSEPLVTFSHFLPREELLPEKRFLFLPCLPKASGSAYLGARVAELASDVHCFGHTHFAWDMSLDGTRYVQAALANPSERLARWHTLSVGAFGLDGPLPLWSADEGFVPPLHCRWSTFYQHRERMRVADGREFEMARYAARFARTDKRAAVVDPDFSHESGDGASSGLRTLATDPVLRRTGDSRGCNSQRWQRGVWRTGTNPL